VPYEFDQRVDRSVDDKVAEWGYTSKPSGGLKAFLTVANLCDSITLFGFGGSAKSLDGHREIGHSFKREHDFYAMLQQTTTTTTTAAPGHHPTNVSLFFPTSFPKDGGFGLEPFFRRFADRVTCLARNGSISVVVH